MAPSLKVMLDDSVLDIRDACKKHPNLLRDTLISALLLVPLDGQNIKRVQLGEAFRRSLQAERQSTPYRLHSIVSACKEGKIDGRSLEAKFFGHGGVRAVTALAAAAADDNNIMVQLEDLSNEDLKRFLESIDTIKWHPDLLFMAEAIDRKRPSITTKKTYLVRPRPSRGIKATGADASGSRKASQHSRHRAHRGELKSGKSINVIHGQSSPPFSNQSSSHTGLTGALEQTVMEKHPYAGGVIVEAGLVDFEYTGMFNSVLENNSLPTRGSYRVDLDGINNVPPSLDVGGSDTDNFGIDLDQLNTF